MSVILIVIAIAIAVAVALLLMFALRNKANRDDFSYQKADALFTPAERSFLGVLDQAIGNDYRIFGKTRIADFVNVRRNPDRAAWQRAFNRISAKHFDFLLCDPADLSVVCAIELDDRSHASAKRGSRDEFVVNVCRAAELPLFQTPAKRAYQVNELRTALTQLIALSIEPTLLARFESAH